jgi:hypothetical protein
VRVTLDSKKHAAYYENHATREAVNEVLQELAANQIIIVQRLKHQEHLIDKLELDNEQALALYQLLGRAPRTEVEAALRQLLEAQTPQAQWQTDFVTYSLEQLGAHRSVAPLRLEDANHNRALLAILAGLAQLSEPTLERVFSVRTLSDSKGFEALRGDVLRVLRKFSPHAEALQGDDPALLAAHFIERVPEYVQLAGSLTLRLGERLCECAPFAPSLALPASLLRVATIEACDATKVVTIENATSFAEFCRVRPPQVLVVFSGGFASPTVIQLLRGLRSCAPGLKLFHWGDLDVGGLRIVRHLRQQLGEVTPLLMDVATLDAYSHHAQPLSPTERAALATLKVDPLLANCHALIEALLHSGHKLEQEAVPFEEAVRVLSKEPTPNV